MARQRLELDYGLFSDARSISHLDRIRHKSERVQKHGRCLASQLDSTHALVALGARVTSLDPESVTEFRLQFARHLLVIRRTIERCGFDVVSGGMLDHLGVAWRDGTTDFRGDSRNE